MITVNALLNRAHDWQHSKNNGFTRHIAPRITNLFATAPFEGLAIAQNIIMAPIQVLGVTLNCGAKLVSCISGSKSVKNFQAKMPDFTDLLRTITRIFTYTIGTLLTATVGFISPSANFKIQCALALAINRREELAKMAILEAELERLTALAELAARNQSKKIAAEKREFEQKELNNQVTVHNIVNLVTQNTADSILKDVRKLYADPKVVIAKIEQKHANGDLEEFENDLQNSLLSNPATTENTLSDMMQMVTDTAYNGVIQLSNDALDLSKRVGNYFYGFFFSPETELKG